MEIAGEKRKRECTSSTSTNEEEDEEKLSKIFKVNETVIPFDFIECECQYTVVASDKIIKMPADFMKLACSNLSELPRRIDLSSITEKDVINALTFYIPRSNR